MQYQTGAIHRRSELTENLLSGTFSIFLALALCSGLATLSCSAAGSKTAEKQKAALNIDGTYFCGGPEHGNKLRVKRRDKNHIWYFLNAYYWHEDSQGQLYPNFGETGGTIALKDNVAVQKINDCAEPSRIVFQFSPGKCLIEQTGDCAFGHNVNASGIYKRVSRQVSR